MTQPKPSPLAGAPVEAAAPGTVSPIADAKARPAPQDDVTFEDAIARLGRIVEQLERGDLPLETSLGLFEEGVKLARVSQERLDRADRRVEELLRVDGDGEAVTRKFDAKLEGGSGGA